MSSSAAALKKTPLNARHRASGGRMVEFAGWDMPVEYSGISDEHLAVRTRAGLVRRQPHGRDRDRRAGTPSRSSRALTSNDASRLSVGQAQYSALMTPAGTFVDDVLVYRLADDHYLLVVNAGNIVKDYEWIAGEGRKRGGDAAVVNASSRYALHGAPGPGGAGRPAEPHGHRSGGDPVLLVRARGSRRRPGHGLANRATRARTGSRSSCRRRRPSASGQP